MTLRRTLRRLIRREKRRRARAFDLSYFAARQRDMIEYDMIALRMRSMIRERLAATFGIPEDSVSFPRPFIDPLSERRGSGSE
jgi:hypothetical protein